MSEEWPIIKAPTDSCYWFWDRHTKSWRRDDSCWTVAKMLPPTRQTGRFLKYEQEKELGERGPTVHQRLRLGFRLLGDYPV